jgi:hypothetical protein
LIWLISIPVRIPEKVISALGDPADAGAHKKTNRAKANLIFMLNSPGQI